MVETIGIELVEIPGFGIEQRQLGRLVRDIRRAGRNGLHDDRGLIDIEDARKILGNGVATLVGPSGDDPHGVGIQAGARHEAGVGCIAADLDICGGGGKTIVCGEIARDVGDCCGRRIAAVRQRLHACKRRSVCCRLHAIEDDPLDRDVDADRQPTQENRHHHRHDDGNSTLLRSEKARDQPVSHRRAPPA
ncbi:hypothetical protein GCM10007973_23140 [Polymorphobacter multimanifer]|nr:hypothetical protein [Polymorphobacter multimanifer]GGI85935.1 hypothetical protein GCM10007973_23140 [Polymorphobacter multimanifer]